MNSTLQSVFAYIVAGALTFNQAQNWIHEGHEKNRVYICSFITLFSIAIISEIFPGDIVLTIFACFVLGLVNYLVLYHDR